jgi:glycosyltransferase involved in cell wall biosynthesis
MNINPPPLVSIIIPCYNYGNYLKFTLQCILNQTYSDWECLIIDDGSTDNTKLVASEFSEIDKRVCYIYQDNAGPSAARNNGITKSSGTYIQFLDSDDLIHVDKIRLQVEFMERHGNADLVYGDALFFDTNEKPEWKMGNAKRGKYNNLKVTGQGAIMIRNLCKNNFIEISCPLIKKDLIDKIGYFDVGFFIYEDWQYWFRAAVAGAYFVYEPMTGTETYISHGHSSLLGNIKKCAKYGLMMRRYMTPFLTGYLRLYNSYRMLKLVIKNMVLKLK